MLKVTLVAVALAAPAVVMGAYGYWTLSGVYVGAVAVWGSMYGFLRVAAS